MSRNILSKLFISQASPVMITALQEACINPMGAGKHGHVEAALILHDKQGVLNRLFFTAPVSSQYGV